MGYEVTIPLSTFYELDEAGSIISLHIYTHVREDTLCLFGFITQREKDMFLLLISVTGIGPKLAITMLSGMPAPELLSAIKNNDLARLTGIPGVGRKTAERVVMELREKAARLSPAESEVKIEFSESIPAEEHTIRDDTIAALISLGYPKPVAERAVTAAISESGESNIEAVLKRSLKRLYR